MGLWNFLGGNKIGPGHPRYERELRKHNEDQARQLKRICIAIMMKGMPDAEGAFVTEEEIISVLKRFSNCPKIADGSVTWGHRERHINNWNQAQKWLKEKAKPKQESTEYIKYLEQKLNDQDTKIKALEEFVENLELNPDAKTTNER